VLDSDELMVITASGAAIRVSGADVPVQGRATQGRRVVNVGAGDRVVEVSRVAREGGDAGGRRSAAAADDDESADESGDGAGQLDLMR
jgi:DNA gyrase subunit A